MPEIAKVAYLTGARKTPIDIVERSGKDLKDYAVNVVLDSSWDGWDLVRPDGSDIYVIDEDGKPLWYWLEVFDYSSRYASLWVKLPSIPANGVIRIYVVYATKTPILVYRDPEGVFTFFDDFEGTGLDTKKWTPNFVNTVYYELVNGALRIYDATKSSNTYWIYDGTDTGSQIKMNLTPLDNMVIEWKQLMETQATADLLGEVGLALCKPDNTVDEYNPMYDNLGTSIVYRIGLYALIAGTQYGTNISISPDTWYIMRLYREGTNYRVTVTDLNGNVIFDWSGSSTNTIDYIAIAVGAYGGYGFSPMRIDWVRVRPYTDPEPKPLVYPSISAVKDIDLM